MNSPKSSQVLNRPLLLLATAIILLQAGAALATDRNGDAQSQARAVVAGTTVAQTAEVAALSTQADRERYEAARDPQEQARRVIVGRGQTSVSSGVRVQANRQVEADAQQRARRILVGGAG